ncbi:hypothetical protein D0C16_01105 [Cellvibrio sp. KY-GH-1]|nr:hypothetical protein D0C16_01105 [Cellvibrio sp. KY-GH-1]
MDHLWSKFTQFLRCPIFAEGIRTDIESWLSLDGVYAFETVDLVLAQPTTRPAIAIIDKMFFIIFLDLDLYGSLDITR